MVATLSKGRRFGPASFYRESLGIAIPVMLQVLITTSIALLDNFMVAGLGDVKMAAVNVSNQINFVFLIVVNTACVGGGIFLSQHRGAKDEEGMRQSFRFKLIVASAIAILYTALCLAFPEFLVGLMLGKNIDRAAIIAEGSRFLRLLSPSFLPFALSAAIATAHRDIGKTGVPLVVSSAAAALCTVMNLLFIYGKLGAPRMEVAGAALATNVARWVEASAFILIILRTRPGFSFSLRSLFKVDGRLFASILSKSAMMFFSETAWVISETIVTALYNSRGGSDTVAGMGAGWSIANICFLAFNGVHAATGVQVGTTLGAGRLREARERARWLAWGSVVLGIIMGAMAAASTFIIPVAFRNLSEDARGIARGLVLVIAAYIPIWTLLNSQFALARAGGDTLMGLWVDVGVTYLVFIPAALIMARTTALGPVALYGIAKLSDIPKALTAWWWLGKEKWLRNLAQGDGGGA